MIETIARAIEALQGQPWAPLAFIGAFALACLGLPISLFPVVGGVLFGFWGGVLYGEISVLLGSAAAFGLARGIGHHRFKRWLETRGAGARSPYGFRALLAARLIGLPPFGLVNYLCGFSEMTFGTFVASTALGLLPWLCTVTFFADVLWGILVTSGLKGYATALSRYTRPLGVLGALIAVIVVAAWIHRRRKKQV